MGYSNPSSTTEYEKRHLTALNQTYELVDRIEFHRLV